MSVKIKTIKEVGMAKVKEIRDDAIRSVDQYFAYCSCGDALERTGLYPNEATYYCIGCDKTFTLQVIELDDEDVDRA